MSNRKIYIDGKLAIDWDFVAAILRGEQPAGGEGAVLMAEHIDRISGTRIAYPTADNSTTARASKPCRTIGTTLHKESQR